MKPKIVVVNIVGLTSGLLGEHTPFLSKWFASSQHANIAPVLPAVTCSAQATYMTGKTPAEHGIVGNGWYFQEECEIKFWRQSNRLIQAKKIWELAKEIDPSYTTANMCWWYNMYSTADFSLTPRPMYLADGRKLPDCYTKPAQLREKLQDKLGIFPLFDYWGPRTTIRSSQWIADASKIVHQEYSPNLTLIYLPHLDYNLQRFGTDTAKIATDLKEIDTLCEGLVTWYEQQQVQVILLSEYGITNVNQPVHLNRVFRENGLIAVREELGLEIFDPGASKAFAVADHQIAHIYVNDKSLLPKVRTILEKTEGIELILDDEGKKKAHLNHERAGDFVVVADKNSWFTYYYWMDDAKAPDFARIVEIHRKPGYDPVELFTNPEMKFLMPRIAWKLLKKKLGFRMLMDVIPLDATLVKGSHGRIPESISDWPLLATNNKNIQLASTINPTDVCSLILNHLK